MQANNIHWWQFPSNISVSPLQQRICWEISRMQADSAAQSYQPSKDIRGHDPAGKC